jgi:two-component system, OmpR family, sensor histidine kinase MtrB
MTREPNIGLRRRLVIAFVVVAAITSIVVTILAYVTNLYVYSAGSTVIPASVRRWIQRSPFVDPSRGDIVVYVAVAVLVLVLAIAAVSYSATRRVLLPVRQLAEAAQQLADGDLSVRLPTVGHDELTDLIERFNYMANSLEHSIDDLRQMGTRARQFAGDVSHELRTPLAAITAVTDVLDEHALAVVDDSGRAARLVSQEIRHLNGLVEALIEISRFDAGTADLVVDDIDVGVALEQCLATRGWSEIVTSSGADHLRGALDPRRFDVIVANLVGNALRHGAPPVTVGVSRSEGGGHGVLRIEVRDHGPGIPPEALPHVFERFFKAQTARGRSTGSGLGLAIAWENARLHGGTIEAANRADGGVVFVATLALVDPPGRAGP